MMETEEERKKEPGYQPNVMLLGLSGSDYVLKAVRTIRANDLEAVVTMLSFSDALALLKLIPHWLDGPLNVCFSPHIKRSSIQFGSDWIDVTRTCRLSCVLKWQCLF